MEAAEKEVGHEFYDGPATMTEKRVYAYLKTRAGNRYQTVSVIARELKSYPKCIERALGSLRRLDLVTERVDSATGRSFWRVKDPKLDNSIERLKQDMHQLGIGREDDEDDEEGGGDSVVEREVTLVNPDVSEFLQALDKFSKRVRTTGWHIEFQVRLSYPNTPIQEVE